VRTALVDALLGASACQEIRLLLPPLVAAGSPAAHLHGGGEAGLQRGTQRCEALALGEDRSHGDRQTAGEDHEDLAVLGDLPALPGEPELGTDAPALVEGVTLLPEHGELAGEPAADGEPAHGTAAHAHGARAPVGPAHPGPDPVDPAVQGQRELLGLHGHAGREPATTADPSHPEVGDGVVTDHQRRSADDQPDLGLILEPLDAVLEAGDSPGEVERGVALVEVDSDTVHLRLELVELLPRGAGLEVLLHPSELFLELPDLVLQGLERGRGGRGGTGLEGAHARLEHRQPPRVLGGTRLELGHLRVRGAQGCLRVGRGVVGIGAHARLAGRHGRAGVEHQAHGHDDQGHQGHHHGADLAHGILLAPWGLWVRCW